MNIITRLKNYRFLKRILSGKEYPKNYAQADRLKRMSTNSYRAFEKGGCERNLVAAVLKKIRKDYPYQINGWGDAKRKYDEYFEMDGFIKDISEVKEGDYVTMFRGESYYQVKEDNPFHYSIMGTVLKKPITYLYDGKYTTDVKGNKYRTLDRQWHTAFRWATEKEITDFKDRQEKYRRLEKEITTKQKEIQKLYKEQGKL